MSAVDRKEALAGALRQLGRIPRRRWSSLVLVVTNDGADLLGRRDALATFNRDGVADVARAIAATAVPPGSVCLVTIGERSGVSVLAHDFTKPARVAGESSTS